MAKIILSRKGFDSTAGGIASPVIDGQFISLPIPQKGSGLKYKSLKLGPTGQNLYSAIKQLGFKQSDECHMDPNLIPEQYGLVRNNGWMPAFGQHGAAASHLMNQGVAVGDIFLFFGRYRHAHWNQNRLEFNDKKDFHTIYGFMEVGEVIHIGTAKPAQLKQYWNHPHVLKQDSGLYKPNSSLYIPAKTSKHELAATVGTFKFSSELVLTDSNQSLRDWKLPKAFSKSDFTYGLNVDGKGHAKSPARGQEMVGKINSLTLDWIRKMIASYANN